MVRGKKLRQITTFIPFPSGPTVWRLCRVTTGKERWTADLEATVASLHPAQTKGVVEGGFLHELTQSVEAVAGITQCTSFRAHAGRCHEMEGLGKAVREVIGGLDET